MTSRPAIVHAPVVHVHAPARASALVAATCTMHMHNPGSVP